MAKDPYGQGSPYSSWRSGGWSDLMYRQDPSKIIAGKDDLGEYTRAQQIQSNMAGAFGALADSDIIRKIKGGEGTYNLTAGDVDKYAENILRHGQNLWDDDAEMQLHYLNTLDDFTPGGVTTDAQKDAAYQAYLKDNPLLAAASGDNLLYDENLGLHFQDKSGDMVPFAYKEGYKALDSDVGYNKGDIQRQLFENLGYVQYNQEVPVMKGGDVVPMYDSNQNYIGNKTEQKSMYKRGDDWSSDFQYEYMKEDDKGRLQPLDWTLKNLMDKDWRTQKFDDARNLLQIASDTVTGIPDKLKTGLENKLITATGDKYDDAYDVFERMQSALKNDPDYAHLDRKEMADMLGIEYDNMPAGYGNVRYKKGSSLQDIRELESQLTSGAEKRKLTSRAQDYIDKGWAPDDTIDKDIYQELGGTHSPKDGKWLGDDQGFGANFGKDFHAKLEEKAEEFGGNVKKAWESIKDDFKSAKQDIANIPGSFMHDVNQAIYQDDEEGVTYAPRSEQIENQEMIKKQEEEDWLNSQVSEEPESWAEQYERLNQVSLPGIQDTEPEEDVFGETLADDPTEWDSRRTLGDNLLKLVKGDFANPDDTLTGGMTQWGNADDLENLIYDKNLEKLYTGDELREMKKQAKTGMTVDDQRAMWKEKFKDLGVSWDEFKNEISEGVDDVKSDYESWKSKRAVKDVDEDSDGIPDLLDADTQPLEQGAREGTFLEKTGAKLDSVKEGLLQRYGGGEYKEARDEAKVDKFYEDNPDRNRTFDEDIQKELQTHGGKKILTRKMQLDPAYRDYVKKHYPSVYRLYASESEEAPENNLMKAWENEQLDIEPEWEGGSSGTNYYDEENFNFNPGGL